VLLIVQRAVSRDADSKAEGDPAEINAAVADGASLAEVVKLRRWSG
jgi:hypothetical protein